MKKKIGNLTVTWNKFCAFVSCANLRLNKMHNLNQNPKTAFKWPLLHSSYLIISSKRCCRGTLQHEGATASVVVFDNSYLIFPQSVYSIVQSIRHKFYLMTRSTHAWYNFSLVFNIKCENKIQKFSFNVTFWSRSLKPKWMNLTDNLSQWI